MTTSRRAAKKAKKSPAPTPSLSTGKGWRTTDEEEIERRRQRAASEPSTIKPLEPDCPVFGTFAVAAESGRSYEVEIRSLSRRDNSCGCPDHQINGLGTCKHVEAVLARLRRRAAGKLPTESPRIEVFLRRSGERTEVRAQWPEGVRRSAAHSLVEPFFRTGGSPAGDSVELLPALARALASAPAGARQRVRLSRHLLPWVEEESRKTARRTARERFLAEVQAGRATLDVVKHPLYSYQREGLLHLAFTERALLADEMGLGKTVQAIAACVLLRRLRKVERVLVISPASLKGEWEEQIARFTDLPARLIWGVRGHRLRQYGDGAFFYLMNYEQILVDHEYVQQRLAPDVIILDEAQRIKNWKSLTAQAVKRLRSPYAFVLTGTPIENRIDEIYSIAQFLDPSLLGPLFRFNRDFYELDERGRPEGYKNLDELHRRLSPILLRRRKEEVEGQLPARTDKHYFVSMEQEQVERYQEYEKRVAQLVALAERRPLTPQEMDELQQWLACMRMLCDSPYILDSDCRICPKLGELKEILDETLAEPGTKVLVFSEWERMLELVRDMVQEMEVDFAWHTGSVPTLRRRAEIRRFKEDPDCRLFLSTDSGGVGLNLQAASVVINLDLPWNPARLEQRIARAWRKHQTRPVRVVYLVTEDSIEHRMIPLLAGKQKLADAVLDRKGNLTGMALPSGRKAMVERLKALTGHAAAPRPDADMPAAAEPPANAAEPLTAALRALLGDGLQDLEICTGRDGRPVVLAVVEGAADRAAIEAVVQRHAAFDLELLDPAAFQALERLAASGIVQFAPELRRSLYRSPRFDRQQADPERELRLARARELQAQSERKIRMASVLASGGFPLEALPALREGVELGLKARAAREGKEAEPELDPEDWLDDDWSLHLVRILRHGSESLLAATEDDARTWIAAGERLAGELGEELRRA